MPNWSQEAYVRAYRFAAEAHSGQPFPGTDLPYIMHISFVAMEVIACLEAENGHNGNLAVQCALLHDVIEDTGVSCDDVKKKIGSEVAQGVQALTKDEAKPKEWRMRDSLERIKKQPHEIWLVKMADRIANLAPPPEHWNEVKIRRYWEQSHDIYEALHEASDYLGWRLKKKITEYEMYCPPIMQPKGEESIAL